MQFWKKKNFYGLAKNKPKGGTLIKKYKFFFFLLKIIKNCFKVIFNQFDAVLEKKIFLRFGKKIIGVLVVLHRNNIKIQIVHQTINMA
jgi:hypothetical protein